ncbi:MAG: hypothetical protein QY315_09445 [Saprospiraceae bacterium]|nr:MAG: hypothetical protein QY315_09445 [Saprospiraceae bacterium]
MNKSKDKPSLLYKFFGQPANLGRLPHDKILLFLSYSSGRCTLWGWVLGVLLMKSGKIICRSIRAN